MYACSKYPPSTNLNIFVCFRLSIPYFIRHSVLSVRQLVLARLFWWIQMLLVSVNAFQNRFG
jgi:hypothetical protein